jgi:hypothetical protein|tara:strand:+ start:1696 stop:2007 length:312 start_codon:yes stop_codon:yes gene_type:complete
LLRIEGGAIGLASPVFSSRSNPVARRRFGRFLVVFLALLCGRARDFVDALALTLAEDEDDERAAAHRDGASSETADAIVLSFLARARIEHYLLWGVFVNLFIH